MKRIVQSLLVACVGLGALAAGGAYVVLWTGNTSDFEGERAVHLPRGVTLETTMDSLQVRGVLDRRWSLLVLARTTGWGSQIKAGHYTFAAGVSNLDMIQRLRRGLQTPVKVRIPAGTRLDRIARSAAANMAFSEAEFVEALNDVDLAAELGTDTRHLFSYMLPDTYHFYWLADAHSVVRRVKQEYDRFHEQELADSANARRITPEELISIAAIVEWETRVNEEKARIAGVYFNRLRQGWPLQADPTVQYALIELEGGMRRLLYRDYRIDHPYNTYGYRGLPPGPVTNPSRSSLRGTAQAEDHDYMFFVASPDGGHSFNATLGAHNRDAARLRSYLRERSRQQSAGAPL